MERMGRTRTNAMALISQYETTLIVGHVGAIVAILGGYFRLHAIVMRKMALLAELITLFSIEHELLVQHLRNPQQAAEPDEWPTRKNKLLDMLREFQK